MAYVAVARGRTAKAREEHVGKRIGWRSNTRAGVQLGPPGSPGRGRGRAACRPAPHGSRRRRRGRGAVHRSNRGALRDRPARLNGSEKVRGRTDQRRTRAAAGCRLPAAGCRRGANQRGPPAELVRRVMGAIVLRGRGVRGDVGVCGVWGARTWFLPRMCQLAVAARLLVATTPTTY